MNIFTDCSMLPLKPKYASSKSTRNYIKYSGIKQHLLGNTDRTRHQCEVCNILFKCKLLKNFHKQIHRGQPIHKECGLLKGN